MFAQDSSLYRFGSWLVNFLVLNALWTLASLPLITIGASTTASLRVAQGWVRGTEPSIWAEFWKSFRQNLLQATAIWLIMAGISAMLLVNVRALLYSGAAGTFLYVFQIIALLQIILGVIYALALLARYHMKLRDLLWSSLLMVHRHISTSVAILAIFVVLLGASSRWPSLLLVANSCFVWAVSFLQVRVFARYER